MSLGVYVCRYLCLCVGVGIGMCSCVVSPFALSWTSCWLCLGNCMFVNDLSAVLV